MRRALTIGLVGILLVVLFFVLTLNMGIYDILIARLTRPAMSGNALDGYPFGENVDGAYGHQAREGTSEGIGRAGGVDNNISEVHLPELQPVSVSLYRPEDLIPDTGQIPGGAAYRVAEGRLDGVMQKIHVLTIDSASSDVIIRPVLSFDRLFGFETLSDMAENSGAIAAVNGGFAFLDGRPAGTVLIDGELMHPSDFRFPSLIIGADFAGLKTFRSKVKIIIGKNELNADTINPWPMPKNTISVFTPAFGRTDRMEGVRRLVVAVSDGKILSVSYEQAAVAIPENGFLIAAKGENRSEELQDISYTGVKASWQAEFAPPLPEGTMHAMSCGSFLVKDGLIVVPESDPWVGSLAGPAPRTAVGVDKKGQLVFVVAEGRIQNGPSGLTGAGLGELLAGMGLVDAALLDGGASSGIIINGAVMNRLSAGRERILPTGFVLVANNGNLN